MCIGGITVQADKVPRSSPRAQTHMTFGKDFTQAVEQKQIAQQGAYYLPTSRARTSCLSEDMTLTPLPSTGLVLITHRG